MKSQSRVPNLAKYSLRGSPPPHPAQLGSPRTKHMSIQTVSVSKQGVRGGVVESPSRGPNSAKYSLRGSPAQHPTKLGSPLTHQKHANLDGERVKTGSIRGGVVKSPSRGPNSAKYSLRGSPAPHPTQLGSPRTRNMPILTVSVSKQGISEAAS